MLQSSKCKVEIKITCINQQELRYSHVLQSRNQSYMRQSTRGMLQPRKCKVEIKVTCVNQQGVCYSHVNAK